MEGNGAAGLTSIPFGGVEAEKFSSHARRFTAVDREKSSAISSRGCRIRECYRNAAMHSAGRSYYEGFVRLPSLGIRVQHAFLVEGGKVVDPTLAIGDRIEDGVEYVGVRFDRPMVANMRHGKFMSLLELWLFGGRTGEGTVSPSGN